MNGRFFYFILWPLWLTLAFSTASAQIIWNGSGSDNNWSTAGNWAGAAAPANDGTVPVQFAGSVGVTPYVNYPWSIAGLAFNSGAGAFTVGGSTLTVGSGGVTNSSSNLQTISNSVTLAAAQTWSAANGSIAVGDVIEFHDGKEARLALRLEPA